MMYFLTGAQSSIKKGGSPQNDTSKSLGGYVSTTPVPNGELNAMFDLISQMTLEKRQPETIAIALVNQLDKPVNNVTMKVVTTVDNIASFKIAAVPINAEMAMEKIPNRYALPMVGNFYNADFIRAYVDLKVNRPAEAGEQIVITPMNIIVDVEEGGMEGTFDAFVNAFYNEDNYDVVRVSDNVFRIVRTDEKIVVNEQLGYYTDGIFNGEFLGVMKNGKTGEVVLIDNEHTLLPGKAIGIWIQRDISKYKPLSDQKLIENYKNKVFVNQQENIELVTNYNVVEETNYNEEYDHEDYS